MDLLIHSIVRNTNTRRGHHNSKVESKREKEMCMKLYMSTIEINCVCAWEFKCANSLWEVESLLQSAFFDPPL